MNQSEKLIGIIGMGTGLLMANCSGNLPKSTDVHITQAQPEKPEKNDDETGDLDSRAQTAKQQKAIKGVQKMIRHLTSASFQKCLDENTRVDRSPIGTGVVSIIKRQEYTRCENATFKTKKICENPSFSKPWNHYPEECGTFSIETDVEITDPKQRAGKDRFITIHCPDISSKEDFQNLWYSSQNPLQMCPSPAILVYEKNTYIYDAKSGTVKHDLGEKNDKPH